MRDTDPPLAEVLIAKAIEMRLALDGIELALMGFGGLTRLPDLFENSRPDLRITLTVTVAQMRQVCMALDECNRIVNSPEYIPANLQGSE